MKVPVDIRKFFGHALNFAQNGEQHDAAKVLKGFGSAGVLELIEDDAVGNIGPYIPSSSKRQFSYCTAFRRKTSAGYPRRKGRWRLFMPGSK
jgi:hypothetical protein